MKILTVIPSYHPAFQSGGPVASVHTLHKALIKMGIDVTVYTTNSGLGKGVPVNREVMVDGVKVTYFSFSHQLQFLGNMGWHFSLPMTLALKRNIVNFTLVYIIGVWNYPALVACHYCRNQQKPYVISPRGLLYPYAIGKKNWKKIPYYYFIAKRDLIHATAIHYTAEDEAESCHTSLGLKNKVMIVANGIDLSAFNSLPAHAVLRERYPVLKDKRVILFLGRINMKKGLYILIKAFHALTMERNDVHLVIVGSDEGGYIRLVKRWVEECGLEGWVTFTGMLSGTDKLAAYTGSDLFVLPSYSENFGMTVVEAMACGLPVLISNHVAISKEILENDAGMVAECNVSSVYEAMKSMLDNRDLLRKLSDRGRKMVEDLYDADKVVGKMMEAINSVL